jgi:hypothetical protein
VTGINDPSARSRSGPSSTLAPKAPDTLSETVGELEASPDEVDVVGLVVSMVPSQTNFSDDASEWCKPCAGTTQEGRALPARLWEHALQFTLGSSASPYGVGCRRDVAPRFSR